MSDVELLGGQTVSRARYLEWMKGTRPLPGRTPKDERYFFESQVDAGMLSEEQAATLLARHRSLQAEEAQR